MRTKILSILLTLCTVVISSAQVSEVNTNGIRLVASKSRPVYASVWKSSKEQRYSPYLAVHHANDSLYSEWSFSMRITSNLGLKVDKGAKLLLLLGNGEIVELKSAAEASDRIGEIRSTGISPRNYAKVYEISVSYPIGSDQIKQIIDLGVKKMRIEFIDKLHDEFYANAKFTNAVKDGYYEVSDHLKRHPAASDGMRDVYDGFAGPAATEVNKGTYDFMKAKASGAFMVRDRRGEETFYDPDTKAYLTREEFLKKYEQWELDKLITLDK